MNDVHGLTAQNLLASLPAVLTSDPNTAALAAAIAEVLSGRVDEISRLSIYASIDEMDEELLDILAHDFKVDWWDADYTLAEKRQTLKSSWVVHKRLGTRYAFEEALQGVYTSVEVVEWYEYDGEPYHFRLHITLGDEPFDADKHKRVLGRARFYKNLRSHLDAMAYTIYGEFTEPTGSMAKAKLNMAFCIRDYGNVIHLSGWKCLDGSWALDQWHFGMQHPVLDIKSIIREQNTIAALVDFGILKARTEETAALPLVSAKTALREAESTGYALTLHTGVRQRCNFTGTLTRNNMWRLDGAYNLDGSRKLNAAIIKEDI